MILKTHDYVKIKFKIAHDSENTWLWYRYTGSNNDIGRPSAQQHLKHSIAQSQQYTHTHTHTHNLNNVCKLAYLATNSLTNPKMC